MSLSKSKSSNQELLDKLLFVVILELGDLVIRLLIKSISFSSFMKLGKVSSFSIMFLYIINGSSTVSLSNGNLPHVNSYKQIPKFKVIYF